MYRCRVSCFVRVSLTGLELTEQARLATVPKDLPVPTFPVPAYTTMLSLYTAFKCHLNKMEHHLIFLAFDTKGY